MSTKAKNEVSTATISRIQTADKTANGSRSSRSQLNKS
jgi:hypothetical protein